MLPLEMVEDVSVKERDVLLTQAQRFGVVVKKKYDRIIIIVESK